MFHHLVAGVLYDAKTSLARFPMVAMPMQRARGRGELLDGDTDVVIEAFPRCASSFAVAAFRLAQEPTPTRIAHHTHMPAQVMRSVRAGVPTLVLTRQPVDAVVSHLIRSPDLGANAAVRGFLRFYEPLVPLRHGFVTATFEEVVGSFGAAIARLNDRFGTSFGLFEHTREHVERIEGEIERDYRTREGSAERLEAVIPRPSAAREAIKLEVTERVRREVAPRTLARAHAAYRALLPST
ncbi:MAG: hypothetical protein OEV60_08540 [Actinomycetota bacterium]|nr:hypothetical protein [Actinomycetota bacterium]MDH5224724.1 hypothetical protein [Actinomycetota bacterium]MDH5313883.1 hypothetical protein [Actinomycetota bacterium]